MIASSSMTGVSVTELPQREKAVISIAKTRWSNGAQFRRIRVEGDEVSFFASEEVSR